MTGNDIKGKFQRRSASQKERADEVTQFVGKLANQKEELDRMVAQGLLDIKSENIYVRYASRMHYHDLTYNKGQRDQPRRYWAPGFLRGVDDETK